MVTMRLMRFGAKKKPSYRIVVMDSKKARQSQVLDTVGTYTPLAAADDVQIDLPKAQGWLAKGAKPSATVQTLLDRVSKSRPASPAK